MTSAHASRRFNVRRRGDQDPSAALALAGRRTAGDIVVERTTHLLEDDVDICRPAPRQIDHYSPGIDVQEPDRQKRPVRTFPLAEIEH